MKSKSKIERVNFILYPQNEPKHLDTGYLVSIKGFGANFIQAHFNGYDWYDNDMNCITKKVGSFSDVAIFEFTNW